MLRQVVTLLIQPHESIEAVQQDTGCSMIVSDVSSSLTPSSEIALVYRYPVACFLAAHLFQKRVTDKLKFGLYSVWLSLYLVCFTWEKRTMNSQKYVLVSFLGLVTHPCRLCMEWVKFSKISILTAKYYKVHWPYQNCALYNPRQPNLELLLVQILTPSY